VLPFEAVGENGVERRIERNQKDIGLPVRSFETRFVAAEANAAQWPSAEIVTSVQSAFP
jgi:hypothetical protein